MAVVGFGVERMSVVISGSLDATDGETRTSNCCWHASDRCSRLERVCDETSRLPALPCLLAAPMVSELVSQLVSVLDGCALQSHRSRTNAYLVSVRNKRASAAECARPDG